MYEAERAAVADAGSVNPKLAIPPPVTQRRYYPKKWTRLSVLFLVAVVFFWTKWHAAQDDSKFDILIREYIKHDDRLNESMRGSKAEELFL